MNDPEFDAVMNCFRGATVEPLSRQEEREMFRRYQQDGDMNARTVLVRANIRFVIDTAKGFRGRLPAAEAVAAGSVGLLTALEKFDVSRGLKFITYAVWWIRQAMHQASGEQNIVRRPDNQINHLHQFHKVKAVLEEERDGTVSAEDVVEQMGITSPQGKALLSLLYPVIRIDKPAFEGRDKTRDSDETFAAVHLLDPVDGEVMDEQLDQKMVSDELIRLLEKILTPRERKIVGLYFGFAGNRPLTLEQIGQVFGLTRERVRQIKKIALGKLKKEPALKQLMQEYLPRSYPVKNKLTREKIERAARMYSGTTEAAAAVGCSAAGFERACRKHGIEAPGERISNDDRLN